MTELLQISTYVTPAMKRDWQQLLRQHEASGADLLRTMIKRVLASNPIAPESPMATQDMSRASRRVHVRFQATDYKALCAAAARSGMNRQTYIRAVVRADSRHVPTATSREIAAVQESNRQLAAVGRNLNQIAHAVNIDFRHRADHTDEALNELLAVARAEHQALIQLVRGILHRWTNEGEDDDNT